MTVTCFIKLIVFLSLLDQLINQTNILIEILDDTINLIKCLQKKQTKLTENEMSYLQQNIYKTADLVKSYMKNYDDFLEYYVEIEQ